MRFYGEIAIQSNAGERYLFPAVLERETAEAAKASLHTTALLLGQNAKTVEVAFEPIPADGFLRPNVETRVKNHLGHIRAGILKINELELSEASDHDGESFGIKVDREGRNLIMLKERSYPLFRLLANYESTDQGEVFAIAVPPDKQIGAYSPIFEAYDKLEAEHQSKRSEEEHDT